MLNKNFTLDNMKNKIISLDNLIKLVDNESLSERYVKYLCGLDKDKEYRHQEIFDIQSLLSLIKIGPSDKDGFIYGYCVPQLNKEFDLLKITTDTCINIELKSNEIDLEKIKKQLVQNRYYLKMLNKNMIFLFTFISCSNRIYTLSDNDVVECDADYLRRVLCNRNYTEIDLDEIFTPKNILVSPLNSPDKFLSYNYLLTEHQTVIKKDIISYIDSIERERFIGLTGGPGTGKTLLIYDIAHELEKTNRILLIHSGILCTGHDYLNRNFKNVKIIPAKELRMKEIKDVDIVIVDEAHRLYESLLDKIKRWVEKTKKICIFSYDVGQKLSNAENRMATSDNIALLCGDHIYKLTNKIRTNKELALFITCLRDLSKFRPEYRFDNVKIYFEPNKSQAVMLAKKLSSLENYTYISYTASFYDHSIDYQKSDYNTHNVIGQEFDKVCMILDDNFYYEGNRIHGEMHPNPDYIFEKLLYQGLTRVRSALAIIITSEELLDKILVMF